ncbi:response regulator [Paucibacter soli]|uniref:response regulator n=1 Tax=Paucibacter soli TaxID=3133433 RepID=UPI0030963281
MASNPFLAPAAQPSGLELGRLSALIIDESELQRSVLGRMLRDMGVPQVAAARRPEEAHRMIKSAAQPYDIILSEFHFSRQAAHDMSGQDLLDELRQSRGLPMQTAFIMVTDEARHPQVASALEGALDDYLLKPITRAQFEERLQVVLERKAAFKEVFQAIDAGDYAGAAQRCERMFQDSALYKVYAARIGSELYLRLKQLDAARRMLESLLAHKAVPWARLGLAKIDLEGADPEQACRSLETLLAENPAYVDAYDVYGRALLEKMEFESAAEVFAKAVQISPGNVSRLQKLGMLQLYLGESAAAAQHLGAALEIGAFSRALDYQGVVALGVACLDLGGKNALEAGERAHKFLQEALMRWPESFRLRMLMLLLDVVQALQLRQSEAVASGLVRLAAQLEQPEFSFEMAGSLIQLIARSAGTQALPEARTWVARATQRFCVSHQRTRLLELAAARLPVLQELVRESAATINEQAREAMGHLVNRQPELTLRALVDLASRSLNGRIIKLAQATLEHHGQHLNPALAKRLAVEIEMLQPEVAPRAIVKRRV